MQWFEGHICQAMFKSDQANAHLFGELIKEEESCYFMGFFCLFVCLFVFLICIALVCLLSGQRVEWNT